MRTKDHDRIIRHLIQFIHKYCATLLQIIYNEFIMNHLMTDVDWRTKAFECAIDDRNSTIYTCTKASRICQ